MRIKWTRLIGGVSLRLLRVSLAAEMHRLANKPMHLFWFVRNEIPYFKCRARNYRSRYLLRPERRRENATVLTILSPWTDMLGQDARRSVHDKPSDTIPSKFRLLWAYSLFILREIENYKLIIYIPEACMFER